MKRLLFLLFALLTLTCASAQTPDDNQSQSYTTITSVTVSVLSNGVQIKLLADGLLQYQEQYGGGEGKKTVIAFPDARNGTGKNFWNVNKYPVSHLQMITPQGAKRGIGLEFTINTLAVTGASVSSTPDGQGVLITVRSDRTTAGAAQPGAKPGESAPAPTDDRVKTQVLLTGGKLTVRAVKADIHGLIAEIARLSGVAVAVDDAVNRTVSLTLKEIDPELAIRTIASAQGLALDKLGGVLMLSEGVPTDLATYRLSGTQSFRMQNTQAREAQGLLPNFLYQYLNVNAEQNAIVVTAPSQMLAKIGRDLSRVDLLSPQIVIEAIAVEFSDTTDKDVSALFNQSRTTSVTTGDSALGKLTYSTIGALAKSFDATLKALEIKGKAWVRARPQMAVLNGKNAEIFIGAQRFVQVQSTGFGGNQTRIQPVDVGVKFSVTPLTGGNGEITTRISPEVSNITELDIQTGLPVLSTRRADTTVRVKDGETIAIGGLILQQDQRTDRKIPGFGDLPLVGHVFRSQKRNQVQTELVIFITPRILPPDQNDAPKVPK